MSLRLIFDEDAKNYDKWRPRYCEELFSDIIRYAGLSEEKRAVEVGCGTGQATEPILETGCFLTAIEPGTNLSAFIGKKYAAYGKFKVVNADFENYRHANGDVDLIYSATAFHWISEEAGYKKAYSMLRPRGALALFWNRPFVNRKDDPLHGKIQSIYKKYAAKGERSSGKPRMEDDAALYSARSAVIGKYGFSDIELHLYNKTRSFRGDDYISLLNTYSDHRAMRPSAKRRFEEEIRSAIEISGGPLVVYDTMDLHLARKP